MGFVVEVSLIEGKTSLPFGNSLPRNATFFCDGLLGISVHFSQNNKVFAEINIHAFSLHSFDGFIVPRGRAILHQLSRTYCYSSLRINCI